MATPDPFEGGPFAPLFRNGHALHFSARNHKRRAALAALLAWGPLVLLSVAEPGAMSARVTRHLDVDSARYLVALPLLIVGLRLLTRRLNSIVQVIKEGGYVSETEMDRLDRLLDSTRRLLGHPGAAVGIVLAASGISLISAVMRGEASATPAAGLWRLLVSQPLFLGCLAAWLWRSALWAYLLWHISTFHLRLSPAHPDLTAGLLFVSRSVPAFVPFALAIGTVAAMALRHSVVVEHRPPSEHAGLMMALLAGVLVVAAGPLLPLARPIRRAQLRGVIEYGTLANQLGRRFEERWLYRDVIRADALGSPDFSATTDLYSIAANVTRVRLLPFDLRAVLTLLLATLLPFVPVAFLTVPANQLLHFASSLLM
jgi:hypothetical protein